MYEATSKKILRQERRPFLPSPYVETSSVRILIRCIIHNDADIFIFYSSSERMKERKKKREEKREVIDLWTCLINGRSCTPDRRVAAGSIGGKPLWLVVYLGGLPPQHLVQRYGSNEAACWLPRARAFISRRPFAPVQVSGGRQRSYQHPASTLLQLHTRILHCNLHTVYAHSPSS